jgi:hypothetical protein
LVLTISIHFFSFQETYSIFPELFPRSPPGTYFNSGNNEAWVKHHEKLQNYFSQFPSEILPHHDQLWKDAAGNIIFVFLPQRLKNPFPHLTRYLSCKHKAGTVKATHHGFHLITSHGTQKWTLFQETSRNFLKLVKPFLFYVEEVLLRVCWEEWSQMRLQVPLNYGFFGTLWTTMVHNPSFSN